MMQSVPKIEDKFSIGKDTIAQLLGKNIIFSSNQGSTESIYFSQGLSNIRMSSDSALNKSKGFTIYWQPDNTVADKTVMIELYYDAIFEKSLIIGESKLPEKSKSILIFANDVGSYTVNSDDLNYFPSPLNAFQISIHRGNYKVLNLNNSEIPVMIFDKHTLYQRLE